MKKLMMISTLVVASGSLYAWNNAGQIKPATATNSTATTIKLAEAKAALSKANTKNAKNNLGTADGGI